MKSFGRAEPASLCPPAARWPSAMAAPDRSQGCGSARPRARVSQGPAQRGARQPSLPASPRQGPQNQHQQESYTPGPGPDCPRKAPMAQRAPHLFQTCLGFLFDTKVNVGWRATSVPDEAAGFSLEGLEETLQVLGLPRRLRHTEQI